ncbi:MAG: phage tail tape measure protein [Lachnospiraceae bacterium]|nr:phage tail tape measure protein [Lachnospiraceae bacterium]
MDNLSTLQQEIPDEAALKEAENSIRGLQKLTALLKKQLAEAGESFTKWLSVNSALTFGIAKAKEAISELIEIDGILTEISKSAGLTEKQMAELGDNAFEAASKYGKSAADYLAGVKEMYRSGFDNAGEMAELSLLAQAAGDMTAASANDYLKAADEAYHFQGNIEALNAVLDSQNHMADSAAVSLQDMADATAASASAAAQYGVEIDELSALIATVAANTESSGVEIGNALKTIFDALQNTAGGTAADTLHSLGISMTEMVNCSEQLKTPVELLKEVAEAFNNLPKGDARRADILAGIGSGNHADTLSALLSDWESYESMLDLYSRGAGSAAMAAEKSAGSMEASLVRLGNTWTDLVGNFADSEAITGTVDALNGLLSIINSITDNLDPLGTAGLGAGLLAGVKNTGKRRMSVRIS